MSETLPFRPYAPGSQPALDTPAYVGTRLRHPKQAPVKIAQSITELSGPRFSPTAFAPLADMTRGAQGAAIGERIIIAGRITDEDGRPVPHSMIEIWQANAAGRYDHPNDSHDAPLDPNFHGAGRVFSDAEGNWQVLTIKPGAYPWPNHVNAWRPNHVHFSLFGPAFATRLVTQMYFPGDPLLEYDPVFNGIPDAAARNRLIAAFDPQITRPDFALGYRFDIVLRGRGATPMEA
ncbi:MAG: protocatechuate 3,4-dioxygenase subunit beta [Rhodospirillales bacterium]|nr:protocatechuate 3,4-dioxygenase subunit beta [Rhodospirillales bacterium]